jgi:hypothetical protein
MKMIAAMQARSDTVRGAPPRAWEGGGGSRGWMRCHSASGRSLSARVVMSGDHHTTHPTRAIARRGSGMSFKPTHSQAHGSDLASFLNAHPIPA